jgi:hypothetical protein
LPVHVSSFYLIAEIIFLRFLVIAHLVIWQEKSSPASGKPVQTDKNIDISPAADMLQFIGKGVYMKPVLCLLFILLLAFSLWSEGADPQYMAADQSLLLMPTAYTMPVGSSSLTDYEIAFLQYTYAATPATHLSAAMVFPIHEEVFKTFTLGVKQNYLKYNKVQSAVWLNFNPDTRIGTFGNVISYGNPKASAHLAALWVTDLTEVQSDFGVMMGGIVNLSERTALLSEIISTSRTLDQDGNGVILFGIRFKGKGASWDVAGIRLLKDHPSEIIMLPYLKATFVF